MTKRILTRNQRRYRSAQLLIAGCAVAALGVAITAGDVNLVIAVIEHNVVLGIVVVIAGFGFATSGAVALARLRRSPTA